MIGHNNRTEDKVFNEYTNFIGYTGDAPTDEASFNALIEAQGVFEGAAPSWAEVNTKIQNHNIRVARAELYPPMADYLDGVVKGDQVQIDKYIVDCQAVKTDNPLV